MSGSWIPMLPHGWAFDPARYEWKHAASGYRIAPSEDITGAWNLYRDNSGPLIHTSWYAALVNAETRINFDPSSKWRWLRRLLGR